MKFNCFSIIFKLITLTVLTLVLLIFFCKPTINHTQTNISAGNISTSITITSNKLFILDYNNFKYELYNLYSTNELPDIMLSELHYDESYNTTIELIVYANKFSRLFHLEPYIYIFEQ